MTFLSNILPLVADLALHFPTSARPQRQPSLDFIIERAKQKIRFHA